jgi:hypothetical protein
LVAISFIVAIINDIYVKVKYKKNKDINETEASKKIDSVE